MDMVVEDSIIQMSSEKISFWECSVPYHVNRRALEIFENLSPGEVTCSEKSLVKFAFIRLTNGFT